MGSQPGVHRMGGLSEVRGFGVALKSSLCLGLSLCLNVRIRGSESRSIVLRQP